MIYYQRPVDEDAPPQLSASFIDDQSNWWVSIQQCGAVVALAVALSLPAQAALAQQTANQFQDDPAGSLFSGAEEYYWQNPVPPVPQTFIVPAPWIYDDQMPVLFGQPEEYYWQNQVAPVTQNFLYPQQWIFDDQIPALSAPPAFQPDEDFWVNPVAPVWNYQIPVVFTDDVILVPAFQMDEDFWQNPVAPISAYPVPTVFTDDVLIVPQLATFQPDEDFWTNPIAPVQAAFYPLKIWDSGDAVFVRQRLVIWIQEDDS